MQLTPSTLPAPQRVSDRHRVDPPQEDQWAPAQSKAFADEVLSRARQDIAWAVRDAVKQQGLRPDELAKRCATSREAVAALLAGTVPSSLELLLRMAGAVGITVDITVSRSK